MHVGEMRTMPELAFGEIAQRAEQVLGGKAGEPTCTTTGNDVAGKLE